MTDLNKDLMSLAQTVATLIEQDGAANAFISASKEDQVKMGLAYVDEAGRRIKRLQNLWLTNPTFKEVFLREVMGICKEA